MTTDHDPASAQWAIDVRGLRKSYGGHEAVRGVDLQVAAGECFALLGPNGAGKTTTVEILEGHRSRSSGEVSVLGRDPGSNDLAYKRRVGVVLQSTSVDQYLSVEETINQFRGYYPRPLPLEDLLDLVGLREQRKQRVKKLSGGQQRRLDVAIGLAGDPELLFLDEPTTGFDPAARRGAWEMVRGLKSLGKTVLLTTHYMEEAEYLADRVAIMAQGRIVALGAPGELALANRATTVRFRLPEGSPALPAPFDKLRVNGGEKGADGDAGGANGGAYSLETDSPTGTLHALTSWAVEHGVELEELSVTHPTLEDLFIELVGGDGESGGQP